MRVRAWHVALAALLGAFLPPGVARADAVMPPPEDCPPGQVGTTSHGGPACAREAPKNCAPGYRGEVGGSCVLADCSSDQECEAGTRCVQVDACQELRELNWNGWYWRAQQRAPRTNLLGAPPAPQPEGGPPKAWVKLRICGQDGACNSPAECRPMGLCYPPGAIGKTKAKVVSAPPVAEELPEDVSSRALIASDPRTEAEMPESREGGCRRGCSISTSANLASWLSVPLLIAANLRRRSSAAKARFLLRAGMIKIGEIKPHMPVVCSEGGQFAEVDHMSSDNRTIKLAKDESGKHHYIPVSWIKSIDSAIHIDRPGHQAKREWSSEA